MQKVNIIGAGLAGLSAGIHLQKLGIDTEIFELAPWAGGMCTAWERGGYRFDGCIHWMVGTRKGDPIYRLYREVEALGENTTIYNAPSIQTEIGGTMHEIPLTFDAFSAFLFGLAGGEDGGIDSFLHDIKTMMRSQLPMGMPSGPLEAISMMLHSRGFLMLAMKHSGKTVEEYLKNIQSDTVKKILYSLMPPPFSAVALVMMLGTRMSGNAGYPLGGAKEVTRRMVETYEGLGGKIHYNARVDEILLENGQARGVRVKDALYKADGVIAACDAYDTLKHMLGGKYPHPQLDTLLKDSPLFEPLALVSFGLDKRFSIPFAVTYEIPEGIATSPDTKAHAFSLRSFDFDESAAPKGASSVMAAFGAPLDWWQNLRDTNPAEYKRQKQNLADAVADALEKRIPGIQSAIRVTDVSTPATYTHLTNVYKASFEGFAPIPATMKKSIQKALPGVAHLYLCGQWTTAGGGICTAVYDGKVVAQKMAKELKASGK